jgi:hypothetical protein
MSGFTYGEWRWIAFAFIGIFCTFAGLAAGEGPAILLFLPVCGFILFMAYRRLKQ